MRSKILDFAIEESGMDIRNRRLFLSSNSVYKNLGYLEHTVKAMAAFTSEASKITFIPFAAVAEKENLEAIWNRYAEAPRRAFAPHNIEIESLNNFENKKECLESAEAIFIGGGNTHHLLFWLRKYDLIETIRDEMLAGKPMLGSSAGTNIFCPTICTTNDMPIISNPTFDAINAVPFQINPHYLDPDPNSEHRGETREQRIQEYLKVNKRKVLGLREGAWIEIDDQQILLKGLTGARLFNKSSEPMEFLPKPEGTNLNEFLLN